MSHNPHVFKKVTPQESPNYSAEAMPLFEKVREITSTTRPPGTHGCRMTEIVPGLFTAHFEDINTREALEKLPFQCGLIVNSAVANNQCPTYLGFYGPEVHVLPIPLYDDPKEGEDHLSAGDAKQYFKIVNDSILKTISEGKVAIVHCYASLSRSVCFILAYLMAVEGMTLLEATAYTKAKWDATYPNDSFVFQLIAYESELRSTSA